MNFTAGGMDLRTLRRISTTRIGSVCIELELVKYKTVLSESNIVVSESHRYELPKTLQRGVNTGSHLCKTEWPWLEAIAECNNRGLSKTTQPMQQGA